MSRRFFYSGDVNIEHGGFFYCLDTFDEGSVDVLRVTPCSDAGGPDNCFWIDALQVPVHDKRRNDEALASNGITEEYAKAPLTRRRHMLVQALVYYGLYDQNSSNMIRIGGPDPFHKDSRMPEWDAPTQYSERVNLQRLAREKCREL